MIESQLQQSIANFKYFCQFILLVSLELLSVIREFLLNLILSQRCINIIITKSMRSNSPSPEQSPSHRSLLSSSQRKRPKPEIYRIGIRAQKTHNRVYHARIIDLNPNQHLIINHGEDLLIYNSKNRAITSETQLGFGAAVINASFSSRWRAIFLLEESQRLRVYSDSLVKLNDGQSDKKNKIEVKELRHCVDFRYLDEYSAFLVLTAEHFKLVYVQIFSNHLHSLFANAYKFSMKEIGVRVFPACYFSPFAQKIQRSGDFICTYNITDIKLILHKGNPNFPLEKAQKEICLSQTGKKYSLPTFNTTPAKKMIITLEDVCEAPQQIAQVMHKPDLNLVVIGTIYGVVRVYRINFDITVATTITSAEEIRLPGSGVAFKLQLHNYKSIKALSMYSPTIILSLGQDQHIEVISLEQMNSIANFRVDSNLQDEHFLSRNVIVAVKSIGYEKQLFSYEVCLDYQLKLHHNSSIVQSLFDSGYILLILTDNSLNFLLNDPNGMEPKQTFIPPRCKSIVAVQRYPYSDKNLSKGEEEVQFWLLTDQSQIYRYLITYNLKGKMIKIEIIAVEELTRFNDSYNHETHEKVISMKFCSLVPVYFDSDVREKKYHPNTSAVAEAKPIAFGCQTGEVLICSCLSLTSIICRVRYFGEPVKSIAICNAPNTTINEDDEDEERGKIVAQDFHQQSKIVYFCSEKEIICIKLSNHQIPKTLYKFQTSEQFFLKQLGSNICGIASRNIVKILFTDLTQTVRLWIPEENIHQATVSCVESCGQNLFVSGDEAGSIALWTLQGNVLVRVQASEPICIECCYFNNQKLTFGYNGKIFQLSRNINIFKHKMMLDYCSKNILEDEEWIEGQTIAMRTNQSGRNMKDLIDQLVGQKKKPKVRKQKQIHSRKNQKEELDDYLNRMRKSLIKLNVQTESNPLDKDPTARKNDEDNIKLDRSRNRRAHSKYQLKNSKISMIEGIQKKTDISLPKISSHLAYDEKVMQETARKPIKNRNKKYQFLFHFPNKGLYTQLISKNMLH